MRQKGLIIITLVVAIPLIGGCAHHPLNPKYDGRQTLSESIRQEYEYPKTKIIAQEKIIQEEEKYVIRQISFLSQHNVFNLEHRIVLEYYDLRSEEKTPVIMVLPILGGNNGVMERFARYFAQHGYRAAIVHRQEEYKEQADIEVLNNILKQMVIDHKQAIDWLQTRPEIDSKKIAVFGVSMGGIKAALLAGLENRTQATVICLAGSNIPNILTFTKERGIIKKRLKIMAEKRLSEADFESELKQQITCDPLYFAPFIDAKKTLIVISCFDRVVPTDQQLALRQEIGKPETIFLPTGHYLSVLYLPYVKRQALRFFQRQFDDEP